MEANEEDANFDTDFRVEEGPSAFDFNFGTANVNDCEYTSKAAGSKERDREKVALLTVCCVEHQCQGRQLTIVKRIVPPVPVLA